MKLQRPKGTNDILPGESEKWQFVEETMRQVFAAYHFNEIRTPIFEHYEVISRSVGDTTDIVTKEMYDFYDKGDRHITLRPEATAPVVRAYVENKNLHQRFKNRLRSTILVQCSVMNGLKQVAYVNFIRLVLKILAQKIQRQTLRQLRWPKPFLISWACKISS